MEWFAWHLWFCARLRPHPAQRKGKKSQAKKSRPGLRRRNTPRDKGKGAGQTRRKLFPGTRRSREAFGVRPARRRFHLAWRAQKREQAPRSPNASRDSFSVARHGKAKESRRASN